jgi:hypothetical protein
VWHRAIGKEDRFLPLKQTILQGSDPSSPTSTDATLSYVPVVASINDTRFAPPWFSQALALRESARAGPRRTWFAA